MRNHVIYWVGSIVLVFATTANAQLVQDDEDDVFVQKVIDVISDEVNSLFSARIELLIDEYDQSYDLDSKTKLKLKVLSKSIVRKHVNGYSERRSMDHVVKNFCNNMGLGTTFLVNGREVTLDGEEPESPPHAEISVSYANRRLWIGMKQTNRSTRSSLMSATEFQPEKNPRWKTTLLSQLTKDELAEFNKRRLKRLEEMTLREMMAIIRSELLLSPEQKEPVKAWVSKHLKVSQDKLFFANVARAFQRLPKELPDTFTPAQARIWPSFLSQIAK